MLDDWFKINDKLVSDAPKESICAVTING